MNIHDPGSRAPVPIPATDPWFDWLTHRRQGGDEPGESIGRDVERYRERVLDGARLAPGETLVDNRHGRRPGSPLGPSLAWGPRFASF